MLRLLATVCLMLLIAACSRPEVDVAAEVGKLGQFCVSQKDCSGGLSCEAHACCADTGCSSRCESLMEKDGTAAHAAYNRHPDQRAFIQRKCVALCCSGKSAVDLEDGLEIWAREMPGHAGI